jgi:hypothetical protein
MLVLSLKRSKKMTLVSASANCKAKPELACSKILSEAGLKAWWVGSVKIIELDPLWPKAGTIMTWKAGGGLFKAKIITDARPKYVEMFVDTPSADSIIKHTFEVLPDNGTCYTKSVEPKWRSKFTLFLSPLIVSLLRAAVRKEVKMAAKFADIG